MTQISINIPIYGEFDISRLKVTIMSILDNDKEVEVVVSEQNINPKFTLIAKYLGVKHIVTTPTFNYKTNFFDFNLGVMRNEGIKNSTSEFIYVSDGDIVLFQKFYIRKIIELMRQNRNSYLIEPRMRRLPINEYDTFLKIIKS